MMKSGFSALALLLLLAAPAAAQTTLQAPSLRTLTMTGTGTVKGPPDMVDISAAVTTEAPTAAAALTTNTASMNRVFAALERAGVPRRNIQTSNFNVSPVYTNGGPNNERP